MKEENTAGCFVLLTPSCNRLLGGCKRECLNAGDGMSRISSSLPVEPHEAVPEVSKGKVHITQNKHVPIEWFVTTASQSRI